MAPQAGARPPIPLIAGFAVFLIALAYLVASSLVRPNVLEFEPSAGAERQSGDQPFIDTVTVDARDESSWQFLSLATGALLTPPDTTGWDLAFRRFHIISSGAIADAGALAFDGPAEPPATAFRTTEFARDTVNPAIARWYRYGVLTHLLNPSGHLYVVKTRAGGYAKVEILSYYCPGTSPGCVTLRYAFNPSQPSFGSS